MFKVADEVKLCIEAAGKICAKRQKEPSAKQDLPAAPAAELMGRTTGQEYNIGEHTMGFARLAQASDTSGSGAIGPAVAVPAPSNPVFSHSSKPKAVKNLAVQM